MPPQLLVLTIFIKKYLYWTDHIAAVYLSFSLGSELLEARLFLLA